MNWQRLALHFPCQDCWLVGVLHLPERPLPRGVLIVTGGPQYRIGSHRHFVLLAQELAASGIPVMRFDYRGMGDSEGEPRHFEQLDDDLDAAIAEFFSKLPAMQELVLWGLCDGATAAARHAARDPRVTGLVMLNPWVRTEQGNARATLRHYYVQRLLERDFWLKLKGGAVHLRRSLGSFIALASTARQAPTTEGSLPQRLYRALHQFHGRTLIVLSGADLGAREFSALYDHQTHWRQLLDGPRVRLVHVPQANHTFSSRTWRASVTTACADWLASW
ncbi:MULTISPECIES: hydrolase 1, exosortase A system-associated [unclassified Duganella]|uniref:hydrolase 1, exosortase A system-associated n=1 Tax=unclassified Duganella TaxID=2636909 RepID=UPI000E3454E6|nr:MULTISPECIES: hydrolase 1, exosortase A system-associated [unclassified Duganella]RFP19478.1 hydrolase 1, exosortase A system-associated [Duganella sp. BJB475]RFP36059.1 hydrolase 1, exosortase A system-associated [Duganella sp. BJB476]